MVALLPLTVLSLAFMGRAGVILKRLIYATLVVGLFLGSAVVGAAYRDSDPDIDSRVRLFRAVRHSPRHLVATIGELKSYLPSLLSGRSDVTEVATTGEKGEGLQQKSTRDSSDSTSVRSEIVSVSAKTNDGSPILPDLSLEKPIIATLRHDGIEDPLSWLSDSADCSMIRNGMNRRYGPVKFEAEISDPMDREEFRHVAAETCANTRYTQCGFHWCGGNAEEVGSHLSVDTEPVPGLARARLTTVEESGKIRSRNKAEGKQSPSVKRQPASRTIVRQAPVVVAKTKKPRREPSDAALAKTEVPSPMLGRYNFAQGSGDEPDDYKLILRRGNAGGRAIQRSQGY